MKVKDPVCGMMIEEEGAEAESTYEGKTYYFCSTDCKAAFDESPERYVSEPSEVGGEPSEVGGS